MDFFLSHVNLQDVTFWAPKMKIPYFEKADFIFVSHWIEIPELISEDYYSKSEKKK